MRFALGVEYAGSAYWGWQKQPDQQAPFLQAILENAITKIVEHPVIVHASGRTDRGVHALGQVVHFDTSATRPLKAYVAGVNQHLPPDIRVTFAHAVSEDFDARRSAYQRRYVYLLHYGPAHSATHWQRVAYTHLPLDVTRMHTAAQFFVGEHDFTSFRAAECQAKSPIRTVHECQVYQRGPWVYIDITANAFLHHMVRNIVGTLMRIGQGRESPQWIPHLIAQKDRQQAARMASAAGLYLIKVSYPDYFEIPEPVLPPWLYDSKVG